MKVLTGRRPLLYSYQGALPRLPVPSLHDTMERVSKILLKNCQVYICNF